MWIVWWNNSILRSTNYKKVASFANFRWNNCLFAIRIGGKEAHLKNSEKFMYLNHYSHESCWFEMKYRIFLCISRSIYRLRIWFSFDNLSEIQNSYIGQETKFCPVEKIKKRNLASKHTAKRVKMYPICKSWRRKCDFQ